MDDTLAVATRDKFVILGSGKKANFFESVVGDGGDGLPAIEVIHRNKVSGQFYLLTPSPSYKTQDRLSSGQ